MEARSAFSFFLSDLFGFLQAMAWPGLIIYLSIRYNSQINELIGKVVKTFENRIVTKLTAGGLGVELALQEKIIEIDKEAEPAQMKVEKVANSLVDNTESLSKEDREALSKELEEAKKKIGQLKNEKAHFECVLNHLQDVVNPRQRFREGSIRDNYPFDRKPEVFRYAEKELHPSRKITIMRFVRGMGVDKILGYTDDQLKSEFHRFALAIDNGTSGVRDLNGGALTGLYGGGLTDTHYNLTPFGVKTLKSIAQEMKDGLPPPVP